MKATDIRLGDLIDFKYDEIRVKGLVTSIDREQFKNNSPNIPTDFAIFTIRDEDKNSSTYMEYIKYEEEKMKNIHEVLELTKPLTDREKQIINFYENHISNMYSAVEDRVQDVRSKIDEATYELSGVEAEVFGDMEESLIERLEEQEADERRKSIEYYSGKRKEIDWLKEVK
jgi:hypothetical protein